MLAISSCSNHAGRRERAEYVLGATTTIFVAVAQRAAQRRSIAHIIPEAMPSQVRSESSNVGGSTDRRADRGGGSPAKYWRSAITRDHDGGFGPNTAFELRLAKY